MTVYTSLDYIDVENRETVIVPVSRNNLLVKDGNVDISIEKVDELHVHQEQGNFNINELVFKVPEEIAFPDSNHAPQHQNESDEFWDESARAEVPVPDVNEGNMPFDSSVSQWYAVDPL